jgi:hypothetical protein
MMHRLLLPIVVKALLAGGNFETQVIRQELFDDRFGIGGVFRRCQHFNAVAGGEYKGFANTFPAEQVRDGFREARLGDVQSLTDVDGSGAMIDANENQVHC